MKQPGAEGGYTLVEALASLALLGLVSLLLVAGLQTAHLRLARLAQGGETDSIAAAQQILRSRIESSFPRTVLETTTAQIDFDGKNNELDFSAPPPQSHGPDALYHYRLFLAGNGDLRLDASDDLALDQSHPADQSVLAHNVTGLDLAYFGPGGQPNQSAWSSHWQQAATLPLLVRVRLSFAGGDRRFWPTLIVRPAATLDSSCVIDVNTGLCQGRT
jgi:type II secretory pathway pseudopilin PulG